MSVRNGSGRPVDYTIIPPPNAAAEALKGAMRFTAIVTCVGLVLTALGALLEMRPLLWFGAGVALAGGATWFYLRSLAGKGGGPRIQDLAGSTQLEARSLCARVGGLTGSLAPGESVSVPWDPTHPCAKVIFHIYEVGRKPTDLPVDKEEESLYNQHDVVEVELVECEKPVLGTDVVSYKIKLKKLGDP